MRSFSRADKQVGAPWRGQTGAAPAHARIFSLARPKFPSVSEGLYVILDYVKVAR